jgi:hypothetical protein
MPKGRHRRHQAARTLKRTAAGSLTPASDRTAPLCDECGRFPHADWCLADELDDMAGEDDGPGLGR